MRSRFFLPVTISFPNGMVFFKISKSKNVEAGPNTVSVTFTGNVSCPI